MEIIQTTLEERRAATRPNIHENKKKYKRKSKHKNKDEHSIKRSAKKI